MTPDDIAAMVAEGESERLELKATTGERREAAKTACAMLNHQGGLIIIGATSKGKVTGQQVGNTTIEHLSQEFREIDPPAFPSIERIPVADGREVLLVRVSRGDMAPYRYRNEAHRRVGNTNRRMSRDDEHRMFLERVHTEQRWENQPAVGWTAADLDATEIRRTINAAIQIGRLSAPLPETTEEMLLGMGLLKDGKLLRAAVALFGQERRITEASEWTQCLLRVARFQGISHTGDFLDNRQFRGNAFTLLAHAERFLSDHLPIAGRFTPDSFVRIDEPLYPREALREALANALCHREYSYGGGSIGVGIYDDRLEITSTGSLHFGLTPEMLFQPHASRPWNPLIAHGFYMRGIIERWGRGTNKMADMVAAVGLPRPEIEDYAGMVTIRFRPSRYIPPQRAELDLSQRQREILLILDSTPDGLAFGEISAFLGGQYTNRQVRFDLEILRSLNLASSLGRGRSARWVRVRGN